LVDDQTIASRLVGAQKLIRVALSPHHEAFQLEGKLQRAADRRVVVHDDDDRQSTRLSLRRRGNRLHLKPLILRLILAGCTAFVPATLIWLKFAERCV